MLRRLAVQNVRHTAMAEHKTIVAGRGFATKVTTPQPRDVNDPDPNTPWTKVLDRLADVAFMTELFRGVRFLLRSCLS